MKFCVYKTCNNNSCRLKDKLANEAKYRVRGLLFVNKCIYYCEGYAVYLCALWFNQTDEKETTLLSIILVQRHLFITARIRRMRQGSVFRLFTPGGGWGVSQLGSQSLPHTLVPGPFWHGTGGYPTLWSLLGGIPVSGPMSQLGAPNTPLPSQDWGTPPFPQDRLRCGRYASCSFPQDFLVITGCSLWSNFLLEEPSAYSGINIHVPTKGE